MFNDMYCISCKLHTVYCFYIFCIVHDIYNMYIHIVFNIVSIYMCVKNYVSYFYIHIYTM